MFQTSQPAHRMLIRYDARIGHRFVPNLRARVPHEGGGYFVRTNAAGFRSDLEFRTERGNRPRVLFFGDSFTAGDGCDNADRFPERVGEMLGAEIYNFGLSGSGTDQQLLAYEAFARDIAADLVVLSVYVENVDRITARYRESIDRVTGRRILVPKPYFELGEAGLDLHHVPVPHERPAFFAVPRDQVQSGAPTRLLWLYRAYRRAVERYELRGLEARVRGAWNRLRRERVRLLRSDPYPDYADSSSRGWRLMAALVERFADAVAPMPLLVVPIPTRHYLDEALEPHFQARFASLERADGSLRVADLTAALRALPAAERHELSFPSDPHLSPRGHRHVARAVADAIHSRELLPPAPQVPRAARPARPTETRSESRTILGISAFYHDSAACLVRNGEIVAAAQEERFSRVKNDRRFPGRAINYCLEQGGIHPRDLAAVAYYDDTARTFERILHTQLAVGDRGRDAWLRVMPSWVRYKLHLPQLLRRSLGYSGPLLQASHHRSHAASAFYPSPFERAAILTIDGVGEWATASIAVGRGSEIEVLREMYFPHSLGLLYSAFTQFTGFKVNSGEYKMMGLAPYGRPVYADRILSQLVDVKEDGSLELDLDHFGFLSEPSMTNHRFAELFGGPARHPDARITQREMDIAKSIQVVTEEVVLRMARHARELTGEDALCLSGGVALNCVANGRLLREGPFRELWIQPAAGDAGSALGAALEAHHGHFGAPRPDPAGRSPQGGSFLGPAFSRDEVVAFLATHGYPHRVLGPDERADAIAELLVQGRVVGHLCGRLEFGPRALGARSILGDARDPEMQAKLNLKIKYRESFRPFAPSVLREHVADYFELDRESPHMLLVAPVRESHRLPFERGEIEDMLAIVRQPRSDVPAITHVDYSARIQTVEHRDHPEYYDVIRAFRDRTGVPLVVNTSFNVRGEPIVCTPDDAYRCFMRTEMDALVLGDCLLLKRDQPPWPEPRGHVEERDELFSAPAGDALGRDLASLFQTRFLEAAKRLESDPSLRIRLRAPSRSSTWEVLDGEAARRPGGPVPEAQDRAHPDPEAMAAAMTAAWRPGAASDALRPILEELVRLGLRHAPDEAFDEEVSDSIYVMF